MWTVATSPRGDPRSSPSSPLDSPCSKHPAGPLEEAGLPSCGTTKRPASNRLSHVPTCGRISPATHHLHGQTRPNQRLRQKRAAPRWPHGRLRARLLYTSTHAAAPNQLLGGGTQRLRLVLQVSPWRGVGLGLWMGRGKGRPRGRASRERAGKD